MQEYLNASSICLSQGTFSPFAEIELPSSKSISNRLLILQDLSKNKVTISNLSSAKDTQLLNSIIEENRTEINAEDAGTAARFSLAWACIKNEDRILTGNKRLNQRPMEDLIEALRQLGFDITCTQKEGFFPVKIAPINFPELGNQVLINPSKSSQFVSALCLIAPFLPQGLLIHLLNEVSSKPYILMTLELLSKLGAKCYWQANEIEIQANKNLKGKIKVEADWSAAAFWYEMVSLKNCPSIFLKGLSKNSIQGDNLVPELFQNLGVVSKFKNNGVEITKENKNTCLFEIDFLNTPDLAQPFLFACALNRVPVLLKGLHTLKNKETDRIVAMQNELKKLGAQLIQNENTYQLVCAISPFLSSINFETYSDHRMAMASAASIFVCKKIKIENPQVVVKSYPKFWEELQKIGITISK